MTKHLTVLVRWRGTHVYTFNKAKVIYSGLGRIVRLGQPQVFNPETIEKEMGHESLAHVRQVVTRHVVEYLKERRFTTFEDPATGISSEPQLRD